MALYSFIAEEKADPASLWPVAELCRVMEVSRSGFTDWEKRLPSARDVSDAVLTVEIEAIFTASNQTYGAPRVRLAGPPGLRRWSQPGGPHHGRARLGGPDRPTQRATHHHR